MRLEDRTGRRLTAIMFTDIEGYTALTQQNETEALQLLDKQRAVVRRILDQHFGREVKTMGDAFLVEFDSTLDAIECAVEMQETLGELDEEFARKLPVRIGIHLGDVVHQGDDIFGDAVNIASRIEPLAKGGEICISEEVYAQVRNKVNLRFVNLGPQVLKNVAYPIHMGRSAFSGRAEQRH